jgi:hypothetical protein
MALQLWRCGVSLVSLDKLYPEDVPPKLTDMSTWTNRTGHARLRSFTDANGNFWLEQNPGKQSKWAKFARDGHDVAWEFAADGGYSGRMLINGEVLTPSEATKKFLKGEG